MKTKAEKEFDKWIREFVGIQDEYLFQKGTLVRTVAIKYAEFIVSQPSDVSDEIKDIIDCILKFDTTGLSENAVANYFEVIQRDLRKAVKPTIEGVEEGNLIFCDCNIPEINDANVCKRCGGYNSNGF